jgi:hypothetical protein
MKIDLSAVILQILKFQPVFFIHKITLNVKMTFKGFVKYFKLALYNMNVQIGLENVFYRIRFKNDITGRIMNNF